MHPGHFISQSSLQQRLAGLYCLYCLYECQPYKPQFKIYLSLGKAYGYMNKISDIFFTSLMCLRFHQVFCTYGYMNKISDIFFTSLMCLCFHQVPRLATPILHVDLQCSLLLVLSSRANETISIPCRYFSCTFYIAGCS